MKENEIEDGKVLMIGDLVVGCIETDIVGEATYKIPCKVTDINHYGDVICEALKPFPDELDWQDGDDFSWIEPIPLAAEILEKNGFYYDEDRKAYLMGVIFRVKPERYGLFSFEICGCPYSLNTVHELQHALRLCGITLNIEV